MAHLGSRSDLSILTSEKPRFKLRIHDITPERFIPNGDRYVIEIVDFDETILLGQVLVATQDPNIDPRDPKADPTIEQRGVIGGIVISAGNGHLLGIPDPRLVARINPMSDASTIVREAADVPMFYKPGDIVLVDRNAKGRNIKVLGREIRVINQMDVLCHIQGITCHRTEDGDWEQVEA